MCTCRYKPQPVATLQCSSRARVRVMRPCAQGAASTPDSGAPMPTIQVQAWAPRAAVQQLLMRGAVGRARCCRGDLRGPTPAGCSAAHPHGGQCGLETWTQSGTRTRCAPQLRLTSPALVDTRGVLCTRAHLPPHRFADVHPANVQDFRDQAPNNREHRPAAVQELGLGVPPLPARIGCGPQAKGVKAVVPWGLSPEVRCGAEGAGEAGSGRAEVRGALSGIVPGLLHLGCIVLKLCSGGRKHC